MYNLGKLLKNNIPCVVFLKSLPWLFNRNLLTEIKIYFYRLIGAPLPDQVCLGFL